MQLQIIIAHSLASNITVSDSGFSDCQENFVLPPADAIQRCKKSLVLEARNAIASITNLNNGNHHGTQNMISPFSPQEAQLDNPLQKILLPPTDSNAEVQEIPPYKLVYVNGACPRNYRVYIAHSMIGVIFQHVTHWSNGVDSLRYAESVDAAVGLNDFMVMTGRLTATTEQPPTEEELLDIEFDALTNEEWERLKTYIPMPETSDLVAA